MAGMQGVEGMLKKLQLLTDERKSVKVGAVTGDVGNDRPPQVVAKLFSEKVVRPEALEQTVGWIWCPARGITCKDVGDNVFLISFNQASGMRKALEDGPWMISKEVLVVAEFDESKSLDEIDFSFVPIWIRVERLPLGLMNKSVARAIGDDVGEFLEIDDDGVAIMAGRSLRLKVRIDIRKPLRRGVIVDLGGDRGERWCPLSYEHLPDFCYICGVIGHVDRACSRKLGKDEPVPYSKELRFIPPRRAPGGHGYRSQEYRGGLLGRGGGAGSWKFGSSGSGGSGGKSRSDGLSWRMDAEKETMKMIKDKPGVDVEVLNSGGLKESSVDEDALAALKEKGDFVHVNSTIQPVDGTRDSAMKEKRDNVNVNSTMQPVESTRDSLMKDGEKDQSQRKFAGMGKDNEVLLEKEDRVEKDVLEEEV